jgi:hypothetical protein
VKKKLILFSVFAAIVVGSISAQPSVQNWISGEISLIGFGARYERTLTPNISLGANAYWSSFLLFWNEAEAGAFARFYPAARVFFLELGLGFHAHTAVGFDSAELISGTAISPGLGWRIDPGKWGRFFMTTGLRFPVTFGYDAAVEESGYGIGVVPYFALGGAF